MRGAPTSRVALVDVLRGFAMVLMFAYHFAWDLTFYRLADVPLFTSAFWLGLRAFIPGLFLILVGVSLVLANQQGLKARPFSLRILRLAACAALITAATYLTVPDGYIFFGVLHGIAVSSVLALPFLRAPVPVLLPLAALVYAARALFAHPVFDEPLLQWIGLVTQFPNTNDYVPVVPWFANVLVGIAIARFAISKGWLLGNRSITAGFAPIAVARPLAFLGRHALLVYMVHQPLFLALLFPFAWSAGTVVLP